LIFSFILPLDLISFSFCSSSHVWMGACSSLVQSLLQIREQGIGSMSRSAI
jgi:hypothetical protein